jgi:hypothetical protein
LALGATTAACCSGSTPSRYSWAVTGPLDLGAWGLGGPAGGECGGGGGECQTGPNLGQGGGGQGQPDRDSRQSWWELPSVCAHENARILFVALVSHLQLSPLRCMRMRSLTCLHAC